MKIVLLQDDFPPESFGGAGISAYELAKSLLSLGHEVHVVTTVRNNDQKRRILYNGLTVWQIESNYSLRWRWYVSLYNRSVLENLKKILEEVKPDIVHANNIHTYISYASLKLAKQYTEKVVITFRDVMSFNFTKLNTLKYLNNLDTRTTWWDHLKQARKRWNPFRNIIIKYYLGFVDRKVAISHALKSALEHNGIKNVEVIHIGLDVSSWYVNDEKVRNFKKQYNILNKRIILFGGRLSEAKGSINVMKSMQTIVKQDPDVVLLVLGKLSTHVEFLKNKIDKLGIKDNVVFTGWLNREKTKRAYFSSDIVLMPSVCLDAFGRVNIEAMAAKKPVVTTCFGGSPEIVEDGITGYIVNPLFPEQIAEKTIELLQDSDKAKRFGEAGYKRVKEDFNLKEKVLKYVSEYKSLIENGA